MTDTELLFVNLLGLHFNGTPVPSHAEPDEAELKRLCFEHKVTPLIYDSAVKSGTILKSDLLSEFKKITFAQTASQLQRNACFLKLYAKLSEICPVITVKGVVFGSLYPNPDMRITSDYDLLIKKEDFNAASAFLTENGFKCGSIDREDFEYTFYNAQSGLKLELHTSLFSPENAVKNDFNSLLDSPFDHTAVKRIDGVEVLTLSDTYHLLYLILHNMKHFYRSGVGIRQLCDFALFSSSVNEKIDRDFLTKTLTEANADIFTDIMAELSVKYLNFDRKSIYFCNKADTSRTEDTEDILLDILDGGIYGTSTEERVHSAVLTNTEVYSGTKASGLSLIFPPAEVMKSKYGYIKKSRLLLPVAWIHRILNKFFSPKSNNAYSTAKNSIELGKKRLKMMEKHGIKPCDGNKNPQIKNNGDDKQ